MENGVSLEYQIAYRTALDKIRNRDLRPAVVIAGNPLVDADNPDKFLVDSAKDITRAIIATTALKGRKFMVAVDHASSRITPSNLVDTDTDLDDLHIKDLRSGLAARLSEIFERQDVDPAQVQVVLEGRARKKLWRLSSSVKKGRVEVPGGRDVLCSLREESCGIQSPEDIFKYTEGLVAKCGAIQAIFMAEGFRRNPEFEVVRAFVKEDTVPGTTITRHRASVMDGVPRLATDIARTFGRGGDITARMHWQPSDMVNRRPSNSSYINYLQ